MAGWDYDVGIVFERRTLQRLQQYRSDKRHVPSDHEQVLPKCEPCFNACKSASSRVIIQHYGDINKPIHRILVIGCEEDRRSNLSQCIGDKVNDPIVAHHLETFRDAAEPPAGAPSQDKPGRSAACQMRRPRRSAAASSSTVNARSTMGDSIPSPRRSFMYRAHAWQTSSS